MQLWYLEAGKSNNADKLTVLLATLCSNLCQKYGMTTQRHYICFKFSSKTLKSAFEVKILRKYVILEEKMTEITFVLNFYK